MSNFTKLLRGLLLILPIVAISSFAIFAGTTPPVIPTGQISTQTMANFTSYPSGVNGLAAPNVQPLIMLVMSRDEQLFNKAYPDYTALVAGGPINTTYSDAFAYNGYFDPNICYSYSGANNYYQAVTSTNTGTHQCSGGTYWSGNFLNWVAMSRLDVLRWTFYGGTRSTDTATKTVLERAEIPDDLHAWTKVYSGTDINKYAPFTTTTSFCNVSTGTTGGWTRATTTTSGVNSTPVIRAASGAWGDWSATAKAQCLGQQSPDDGGNSARPASTITNYTARVLVCQNASGIPNEAFCVSDGSALKPEGLLQQYSKAASNSTKRFGLVTGSAVKARLAGQLRRNVGLLANNVTGTACAVGTGAGDGDEFSSVDGTFCYKSVTTLPTEGIVMTLDRLQIVGWNGSDYGDSGTTGCYGPGDPWGARGYSIQATPTMCPDFGNPVASMYATALQYIQGTTPTNQDTTGPLPNPTWVDPYGTASGATQQRNLPCAACSIVLVSSGLNTFDAQNVPTISNLAPTTLTNAIQTNEGITGQYELSTYYNTSSLTGAPTNGSLTLSGTNFSDIAICSPATIGTLSAVVGICNGTPGQQGSYLLAGLSYGAWKTVPFRTDGKVVNTFQVETYGVSLSDNLPSFSIPVGTTGSSISISPSCRADPEGVGTFTSCFLGSVRIGAQQSYNTTTATGFNTFGLVPTTTYPNVGSYYFVWEDSQYGSDHDQDANNVISYCIGSSCNLPSTVKTGGVAICDPEVTNGAIVASGVLGGVCNSNGTLAITLTANTILIRNQLVAFSSNAMFLGYEISGTGADGLYEFKFTNGGAETSLTQNGAQFNCELLGNVKCQSQPVVQSFALGTTTPVSTLQTPLWYAAKYSGYTGSSPTLAAGQDPPNYFFARNAGALKAQLNSVFQSIVSSAANNFGNATTPSSSNDIQGNGLSYQVQYFLQRNGVNWTGNLQAFWSDSNGYLREGGLDGNGNEVLSPTADYIVVGPDTTSGALPGATTNYRCTIPPVAPAGSTFNPSVPPNSSSCSMVTATNPLKPAWDATTLLNAYYDPTTTAGQADIANLSTQRAYSADASATGNIGQRYIFTYLTQNPNGSTGTGTVVNGTQTPFVWNTASCNATTGGYTLSATSGFCGAVVTTTTPNTRTGNYGLLNELSPTLAQNLVNWIRGVEDPTDYRSRSTLTVTPPVTYRLGDIVDSSPAIVGTPAESYDLLYNDYTYAAFRSNYNNRRQMVYVGANDGMLHAFNGGFYVPAQAANGTTPATNPTAYRQLPATTTNNNLTTGDTAYPKGLNWALGQEAWAFVPENLLAHLRWLADKNYTHVFYVDGAPVVSDVRLWGAGTSTGCQAGTPATTDIDAQGHVCGWGTVMVVPFRLGGGLITVDTVGSGVAANTQTSNSAYVIMDVTDPEQPPTVLGEITTGTYTLGAPAFAVHRETDGNLHFLLTIGSGPADNGGPTSTGGSKPVSAPASSNLGVWVYDLASVVAQSSTPAVSFTGTTGGGPANSFAGSMVATDFNLNDSSEAVYFGVVTNPPPPSTPPATYVPQVYGGGLWKVNMNTGTSPTNDTSNPSSFTLTQVINTGQPVTIRPSVAVDSAGRRTIYFGTGRSYTTNDNSGISDQGTQQQDIYGVTDDTLLTNLPAACQTLPTLATLFNASSTVVNNTTNGTVTGSGISTATTLTSLENALMATVGGTGTNALCYQYSGWVLPLAAGNATGTVQQPSERVVSSQTLFSGILLTPTYIPANLSQITGAGSSACDPIPVPGTSNLYGLDYLTGTASTALANSFGVSGTAISKSLSLGSGMASSPVLHVAGTNVSAAFGISGGTQLLSIGSFPQGTNGEISWREPVNNQ